jgi:hypothetical protein
MLRELTVDEVWQLQRDSPLRLIPPQPDLRPVRDTVTNEIRFVRELPKDEPCAG